MADFFDLYWQHYMPGTQNLTLGVIDHQRNLFNLYTLKNKEGLILSESAGKSCGIDCKEKLENT